MKNGGFNFNSIITRIRKNPIISVIVFTTIFITGILVITAINLKSTGEIELLVAPVSANVTIDGKSYENGTFRLPIGEHEVKIEKEDFETQTYTIEIKTGILTQLKTYLKQTDGSSTWYETHQEDALIVNTIGDAEAQKAAEEYANKYPIIKVLPLIYANYDKDYNYTEYRIDGGSFEKCPTEFCLQISDTTGGNREKALQLIKDNGYNPSDYTILYKETPIQPLK